MFSLIYASWILNAEIPIFLYSRLYDTAIRLGELQAKLKLQVDPQEYAQENLKFGLVEVVYEWAKVVSLLPCTPIPLPVPNSACCFLTLCFPLAILVGAKIHYKPPGIIGI